MDSIGSLQILVIEDDPDARAKFRDGSSQGWVVHAGQAHSHAHGTGACR